MVLAEEQDVKSRLLKVHHGEGELALCKNWDEIGSNECQNFDCELVTLHGGIHEHHEGRVLEGGLVFLVFGEILVELEHGEHSLFERVSADVESEQALLGVDFAVEFKHLVQVLLINDNLLLGLGLLLNFNWN